MFVYHKYANANIGPWRVGTQLKYLPYQQVSTFSLEMTAIHHWGGGSSNMSEEMSKWKKEQKPR